MSIKDTITQKLGNLGKRLGYNSTRRTHTHGKNRYAQLLAHKDNLDYHDYKKISRDVQVSVGLETIEAFLLSKNYILTSNSDSPEDLEITKFIQDMLDNMDTPFRQVRRNIYTAIKYGFSVQEEVYSVRDSKILITSMYPVHIKTLQDDPFVYDDFGELYAIHQESDYGSVDLPISKCLLYSYKAEFDEVEGRSILDNVENLTRIKTKVLEWLITYLHKHENPVLYAKLADGEARDIVSNMLDEIAEGRTNLTVGIEDELGTLETNHRGDSFFTMLNYLDNLIFRRMFIGNLLYGDGQQTGSYAQSQTQMELTCSIFNGFHEDVAATIQQKINRIVEWNYGSNAKAPKISFESFVEKDIISLLNALKPYVDNMTIESDAPWLKEVIGSAVQQLSGVKVDKETPQQEEVDINFNYQDPLPGTEEAYKIVDQLL